MKTMSKTFLTGLAAIVPITLTIYLVYWLGSSAERFLGGALHMLLPDEYYWPGMGLIAGLALIFAIGFLLQAWIFQRVFAWFDLLLTRLPIIRTVYNSLRDLVNFFSAEKGQEFNQVVAVRLPNTELRCLGFVTRDDVQQAHASLGGPDTIAVYLPMSYQIGGYTLFLPRSSVEAVDIPVQDAMRFVLTAGITSLGRSGGT